MEISKSLSNYISSFTPSHSVVFPAAEPPATPTIILYNTNAVEDTFAKLGVGVFVIEGIITGLPSVIHKLF